MRITYREYIIFLFRCYLDFVTKDYKAHDYRCLVHPALWEDWPSQIHLRMLDSAIFKIIEY